MRDFGYLIVISKDKNSQHLYHQMAYLLALSIKRTQKSGYDKVAVVTDDEETLTLLKATPVIDRVIFWNEKQHWDGRSWMDQLSPWRYTVCLDADMLFTRDYSHWIDYFKNNCELYIASKAYTFRGELIESDFYRKTFTANDLPNLYSAYTWFDKQSLTVENFFNLGRYIIENPTEFKNLYLDKDVPKVLGTDEAFALAAKILDIEDDISYELEFPRFVHLKPAIQGFKRQVKNTGSEVGYHFDKKNNFKIGTFAQTDIVHYAQKDLNMFEMMLNYQNLMMENFKK
jgi:hypothetical protein